MMGLLFALCIIILIVLVTFKSDVNTNLRSLREKIDHLDREIQRLRHNKPLVADEKKEEFIPKPIPKSIEQPKPFEPPVNPPLEEKKVEPFHPEKVLEPVEIIQPETEIEEIAAIETPKPGFFERNPDLEKFIGENLANKIGIGILVIGIGFFVKYAIDHSWIAPIGRVMVGILCGGGLLVIGHRMRNSFRPFSSVLVGGGIAILYTTITIAFQLFHLLDAPVAFGIMVVITAFTIALSLGYNRIELAVLAILGGFGSPFMVSTGEGNYIALFTYVLILNVGMLVLAYYKKWNLINITSYCFSVILFGSWLAAKFDGNNITMVNWAMFFSTALYFVFFGMNIINNIKERRPFNALEFTMLLSNTFFYYTAGMYALSFETGKLFQGLFTILLAVFNFGFAFALYKQEKIDRNLVYLLIGLTLTFVSLAAPVQLEGNYITIFWAAEAVLLLWLSQKSGIMLMKFASIAVNGLMMISLLMDWTNLYFGYDDSVRTVMLNKAYITGILAVISLVLTSRLLKKETSLSESQLWLYKNVMAVALVLLTYFVHLFELQYQLRAFEVSATAVQITTGVYNMLTILLIILIEPRLSIPEEIRPVFAVWGFVSILIYLIFYHSAIVEARYEMIAGAMSGTGFFMHYALIGLLMPIMAMSIKTFRKLSAFNQNSGNLYAWIFVAFIVFLASHELDHIVLLINQPTPDSYYHVVSQIHKIGWPILWGLGAFAIIFIGLKQKIRHLRIISLVLFLITLLKLFLVDIKGISEGGKIAAFISLGILLLIISFMYQRLKKILLDDQPASTESEAKI
jgi:uncharacterized membrane protein